MAAAKPMIRLKSNENEYVDVEREVAELSLTIKNMLNDLGIKETETPEVPLPKLNTGTLKRVVKWCEHHQNDYAELIDEDSDRPYYDMSEWDTKFLDVEQSVLFELLSASNYLDIKGLLTLTCKAVAILMKDKSIAEIRKIFGIEYDFLPEEAEQVQKEIDWLEEN